MADVGPSGPVSDSVLPMRTGCCACTREAARASATALKIVFMLAPPPRTGVWTIYAGPWRRRKHENDLQRGRAGPGCFSCAGAATGAHRQHAVADRAARPDIGHS